MNFSIIGGDQRSVELAKILSKENNIYTYGLEKAELQSKIQKGNNLEEIIRKSNIIIGPMPLSKDGENINAPFAYSNIKINDILFYLDKSNVFIAGAISKNIYEIKQNIKIIDLMEQEELTVLNTIATAEGAIQVAIENTKINIHKSRVLVLGFGRVAKVTAKKFKALDAYVTCGARKNTDLAWIETLGYEKTNINQLGENLRNFDVIINTVPEVILTKNNLSYINKQAIIIDLASKPGGVDQEEVKRLGIKYIWALALPGKVSPVTSAQYIYKTINNVLKNIL